MSVPLYRQNQKLGESTFLLLTMSHDVEITAFGEGGRDHTFKVLTGDKLVVQQDEMGEWHLSDGLASFEDVDDYYEPA